MQLLKYVNVLQGTKSSSRFSCGNTLPMVQRPFGMGGFTIQTNGKNGNWFFSPDDRCVEGIRLTHQPSPWIGDYGCVCFMPQTDQVYPTAEKGWSSYRPDKAVIRPDILDVFLLRYRTRLLLTPTERGAFVHISYPEDAAPRFAIFPVYGNSYFKVEDEFTVTGYTDAQMRNDAVDFRMHFVFRFDCRILTDRCYITNTDGSMKKGFETDSTACGINLALEGSDVNVRIASSYISKSQAMLNLERETMYPDFESARKDAETSWENKLTLLTVKTDSEDLKKTFYSCLARVFMYPHKSYEINGSGEEVHYCPHNGKVGKGKYYTNNGFWDTYRTVYPLLSIISPEDFKEILTGFINIYKDTGWLPRWPAIGENGCMPGTLIDAVIADAAVKGIIDGELLKTAFEGMIKHSTVASGNARYGRIGVEEYNRLGYVPNSIPESVNNSLDSYYGDYCISAVAEILGEKDISEKYLRRSKGYNVLFDKDRGLMRSLDSEGKRKESFDPYEWGGDYTEGSAYQTVFSVCHDLEGLAQLFGSKEKLLSKLDGIFSLPPYFRTGNYGREIHEMSEMAAVDFGQCAISNQPSFHYPFIYSYFGETQKTSGIVRKMAEELFSWKADGFPGDEDNGSMSAWFVFACMGIYPVCPGKAEYAVFRGLADKVFVRGSEVKTEEEKHRIKHTEYLDSLD